MQLLENPFFGNGMPGLDNAIPFPSCAAHKPEVLLKDCPVFQTTPLVQVSTLAQKSNVANVYIKDERDRLGLGSFKALGAAYVIACDAQENEQLDDVTYVTASAGNHGMSVAAGASIFGAKAVVFLADTVPENFAQRLRDKKATVIRHGKTYEESMQGALDAAEQNGWRLLSDSSWPGYFDVPHRLMEGYLQLAQETIEQIPSPPSHIFLQAGVGGFAGAIAALIRKEWGTGPKVIVVEPDAAPALINSVKAGKPVVSEGPVSSMGRLDCKEPSLIALKGLSRDANFFATINDQQAESILPLLDEQGLTTTPSGAAGIATLLHAQDHRETLQLTPQSRVLTFITEGP